jgi:PAS domain S-box-containing protein
MMRDDRKTKKQLIDELTTLRRRIEESEPAALTCKSAESQYKTIIQASMDSFWLMDIQGHFLDVNDAYCLLIGYSSDELLTMKLQDVEEKETPEETARHIRNIMETGHDRFETRHTCKNGTVVDIEVSSNYLDVEGGRFFVFLRDITDRKKIEDALNKAHQELEEKVKARTAELSEVNASLMEEISRREVVQNELRISEQKYRQIFDNMSSGVVVYEAAGDGEDFIIKDFNKAAEKIEMISRENFVGKSVLSAFPGIKEFGLFEVLQRVWKSGNPERFPVSFYKDGRISGWRENYVYRLASGDVVAIYEDVSERKKAEEQLREREERYHMLFDNVSDAIFVHEVSPVDFTPGHFIEVNDAACQYLGYSREELLQMSVPQIDAPETVAHVPAIIKRLFTEGRMTWEGIHIHKDGHRIPVEISNQLFDLEGIPMILAAVRDITERKKAEEALRASDAELHDNFFAQSAINMILSESLENISLELILQKSLDMTLAIPWFAFESVGSIQLAEENPDVLVMKAQANLPGPFQKVCARVPFGRCLCGQAALTQEIQFIDRVDESLELCGGGVLPYGHYAVPILFGGRTLGVINIYVKKGHIRDRKEEEFLLTIANTLAGIILRKQAEEEKEKLQSQLLQAQKMEAVGQLAGGIAHDFNNILTAMIGYGHMLKMKMHEDDPLRRYADHILSLSDRAANLTQSLLTFSRKQIINPRTVDLNGIIKKVENLLTRVIGEDIELRTNLVAEDLTVTADPLQMEQVFMNLATNARDAMPEGGRLEIETEIIEVEEAFVRTHGYGKTGMYALVSVSDTGTGMDEKTREKIFEPFFTTKEVGKGTGLGLAIVYGIVKQHNGYINVYSEQGKGPAGGP